MASRPPPGRYVHCLEYKDRLNWDHVFPAAWYPETTPKDLYKWQIPSCIHCNNIYGVLEKDLMIRLGLCLEPDDPCKGIAEKALRSIDPSLAKNEKDRLARLSKRRQIWVLPRLITALRSSDMKIIYRASNILEAKIVAGMLQAYDITAHVGGYYLQGAVGDLAAGDFSSVSVDEADQEAAIAIVKDYEGAGKN